MEHRLIRGGREGGEGVAICSCGADSDVLPTRQLRRKWFWTHKDEVRESPDAVLHQLKRVGEQRRVAEQEYHDAIQRGSKIGLTNRKMAEAVGGIGPAAIRMYRKRYQL